MWPWTRPTPPPSPTFVYFIRDHDHVKIGFSRHNPSRRLRTLQTGTPRDLHLLAWFHGTRAHERALHRRFAVDHIRGEWFHYSSAIRDFLRLTKEL